MNQMREIEAESALAPSARVGAVLRPVEATGSCAPNG